MKNYETLPKELAEARVAFDRYQTKTLSIDTTAERDHLVHVIDRITLETPPEQFFKDAVKCIADHPGLSGNGYPAQADEPGEQFELLGRLEVVFAVYRLAQTVLSPTKAVLKSSSSYGLKHDFENVLGLYVTNGEMILAMLMLGYNLDKNGVVNRYFNISAKSYSGLRKLRAEATTKNRHAKIDWVRDEVKQSGKLQRSIKTAIKGEY